MQADQLADCHICAEGKLSRRPFVKHVDEEYRATQPLERLNADLFGPVPFSSFGGAAYGEVIIDEATNKVFLALLKNKSDAAKSIIDLINMIRTKKGKCNSWLFY